MDRKPFDQPVKVATKAGTVFVANTRQAADLLSNVDWPSHGPRHRDALEACLKVIDGHRSTIDAETAFQEAAREAGVLRER